ncbi:MAG: mechanosensitive ion channel family protein, partial [Gemmatimonadota bacterium]
GDAGLKDAFVQILDLGDFSVEYRVAGLLEEVKFIVSARSLLRGKILDCFHTAGVEIVSPNFMNTRALPEDRSVIPAAHHEVPKADTAPPPEELIFDKAEEAGSVEELKGELEGLRARISELEAVGGGLSEAEKAETEAELVRLRGRGAELEKTILAREKALKGEGESGG